MRGFVRRLARTSPRELRFRCREKALIAAERWQYSRGRVVWQAADLAPRLLAVSPLLEEAYVALRRGDWGRAGYAVRSHFLQRAPRFVVDPAKREEIAATLNVMFPGARDHAITRAERLLAGRHDLLGYKDLAFGTATAGWHFDPVHQRYAPATFWTRVPYLDPRVGDHKIIWELNRHQHWLALGRAAWLTGDQRYTRAVAAELESWLDANPPLVGINWSSMLELGFRCISWIWAVHFCAAMESENPRWFVGLLLGIDRQLDQIARHLSVYFSPNTHLLGEALALYVGGRVLPELKSASRWERIGRDVLVAEATRQIHPDGGHVEQSAHYHRYALDFYLLALAIARRTADPVGDVFQQAASRLATFCRALADDDGRLPAIGDDDGGMLFPICGRSPGDAADSLALAAALLRRADLQVGAAPEEVLWMLGGDATVLQTASAGLPPSQLFPDTGYAVLRSAGGHAVLDVGRHGFLNGGHAHADALSVVLSVGGQPLLIDPGTATYTMDARLRDRFRSSAMHNTVIVDGREHSLPSGPFHWAARTDARIDLWRTAAPLDCAEALHEGYAPLVHRRSVLRVGETLWLVVDHLLGVGRCEMTTHWHVHPEWTLAANCGGESRFTHACGLFASLDSTALNTGQYHGDSSGLGWSSPVYGRVVPSTSLRFTELVQPPVSRVTAIAWSRAPVRLGLRQVAVAADGDDGWHRTAVAGTLDDTTFLAVFAVPNDRAANTRSVHRVTVAQGKLVSDARVTVLRFGVSAEPLSLSAIDGRAVEWHGQGAFRTSPVGQPVDVHLDRARLELHRTATGALSSAAAARSRVVIADVRQVG